MQAHRIAFLATSLTLVAVSVAGCPALTLPAAPAHPAPTIPTPTKAPAAALTPDQQASANSAATLLSAMSNFDTPLTQLSARLSAASDLGAGASVQTLPAYAAQDLTGAYPAPGATSAYPPPAGASLQAALAAGNWVAVTTKTAAPWMFSAGKLIVPKAYVVGPTGSATESYYVSKGVTGNQGPFASSRLVTQGGRTLAEVLATPLATASTLPAPFNQLPGLPASLVVRPAIETYFAFGGPESNAIGYRWTAYAQTASRPLVAWIQALKVTRPGNVVVNHYDVATRYATNQGRTVPTEAISDDVNAASHEHEHLDRLYDAKTALWTGTGSWVGSDGRPRSIKETWNVGQHTRTRTVSWTETNQAKVDLSLSFAGNRSGSGTLTINGLKVADLAWPSSGQGTMTLANGKSLGFRAHD